MVKNKTTTYGITLLELLSVLAIIAVLLSFSLPSFTNIIATHQQQIVEHDLIHAIQMAKSCATLSGATVSLVTLDNENNWSTGMKLKIGHQLFHTWHWQFKQVKVVWHGFQGRKMLLFTQNPAHSALSGHFVIKSMSRVTKLVVNRVGRVRREI